MLFLTAATEVATEWTSGDIIQLILGILLFISAIFLIVAVLMQTGKSKGVGAIAGGSSETYFGKNKGKSRDKKLALVTTIVAIIFVILALFSFVIQPYHDHEAEDNGGITIATGGTTTTTASGTTATTANGTTDTTVAGGTTDTSVAGGTTDTTASGGAANDTPADK